MATEDQIRQLRQMISEPDDSNGWTDTRLGELVDATDTLNVAASQAWYLKAGEFSQLVDVSESGSSRKLGDLMKNAKEMGALYGGLDGATTPSAGGAPVIQRIRRGFT